MSSNQPGPYQSRLLRTAVQQTRQWLDRGRVALRWLAIGTQWTAQILLHTVLITVQAVRLAGAVVKQGVALGMAEPLTNQEPGAVGSTPPTTALTADTPIQHSLQLLQSLTLATELPILTAPPASTLVVTPPPSAGTIAIHTIARLVRACRSWFQPSPPPLSACPPSAPCPLPTSPYIHAIASQCETRTLVLVTNQNQILDILTPDQQTYLRQRIAWETAHYGRYLRLRGEYRTALTQLNAERSLVASTGIWLPESLLAALQRRLADWNPLAFLQKAASAQPNPLSVPALNQPVSLAPAPEPSGGVIVGPIGTSAIMPLTYGLWDTSLALSEDGVLTVSGATVVQTQSWECVDVQATPLGYVLAPFEALLRMLDRGLLWLEAKIAHVRQPERWSADWQQSQIKSWLMRLRDWFRQWAAQFFKF